VFIIRLSRLLIEFGAFARFIINEYYSLLQRVSINIGPLNEDDHHSAIKFNNRDSYWSNLIRMESRIRFKNGATKCCYTLHTGNILNDCSNQVNVVYNNVRSILNAGFATKAAEK
jgi:hypothetical protein